MVQNERDLRLISGEVHDVLIALVSAIKAEDERGIADCLVRVEKMSEFVEFINGWGEERKEKGYPA